MGTITADLTKHAENRSLGETQLLPGLVSGAGDMEVAQTSYLLLLRETEHQKGHWKGRVAGVSPAREC